jgi:hypothetical protein
MKQLLARVNNRGGSPSRAGIRLYPSPALFFELPIGSLPETLDFIP